MIKTVVKGRLKVLNSNKFKEYEVLNKVPDMVPILVDLMSSDFPVFVKDVEWVSPKPPTFRVVLENGQTFYLSDLKRSWVAEVEGKKYYLLNLGEEERAASAIARILRYTEMAPKGEAANAEALDFGGGSSSEGGFPGEEGGALGGEDLTAGGGEGAPEESAPSFDDFELGLEGGEEETAEV